MGAGRMEMGKGKGPEWGWGTTFHSGRGAQAHSLCVNFCNYTLMFGGFSVGVKPQFLKSLHFPFFEGGSGRRRRKESQADSTPSGARHGA